MFKILSTYICWKKYIKCNIWSVAVLPSYIQDARFLKVNAVLHLKERRFYRDSLMAAERQLVKVVLIVNAQCVLCGLLWLLFLALKLCTAVIIWVYMVG